MTYAWFEVMRNAGIAQIMHMSYCSKTYTWNNIILVKRSMIRVFSSSSLSRQRMTLAECLSKHSWTHPPTCLATSWVVKLLQEGKGTNGLYPLGSEVINLPCLTIQGPPRKYPSILNILRTGHVASILTWQPVRGDLTAHPWTVTLPWG